MIPDVLDQPRPYPGPVISLYLNRDGLPSAPRIRELLKSIRASAAQASHEDAMSIRADSEAVEQLATKLDRTAAASVGIFACGAVGVMEVVELSEPVWDVAVVDTVPYLRPLRAVAETGPVAVAVVERGRAWVFSVDRGSIDKLADIDEQLSHPKNPDEGLKRNYGGWHGYAERRARGHAGAKTQRHFQEAARLISELDEKHRFGHVVVGGHSETIDHFVDYLHPSIHSRLAGTFTADPRTLDRGQVRSMAEELVAEHRAAKELEAIDDLMNRAGSGHRAALGLASVLFAANLHAVDHLVIAGSYAKTGTECPACGWLARNEDQCSACGEATDRRDDIIGAVIERVIADGATTHHARVASRLDADGIGATLRFPVPHGT